MSKRRLLWPPRRKRHNQISQQILIRYVFSVLGMIGGLVLLFFLGWVFCRLFIWQPHEPLYRLLKALEDTAMFWGSGVVLLGVFLLTYRSISKPLDYLDEVIEAAEELAHPADTPIRLSPPLESIQDELNIVREGALRSAMYAKEAEQRKNDLIVYLAHDLKTPLTSVIGYLSLLRDEPQISPEMRAKYTGIALEKAERLEALINEFFEITRFNLTQLSLRLEEVNLTRLLEQVTFDFQPILAEKGLSLSLQFTPDVILACDPEKLERVFDNLLRNAVNYSNPNTPIGVTMLKEKDTVIVSVENQGRTIPQDKLDQIFEQFFRLDSSRSSSSGGAGLGLAIAKEIVERHNGIIRAQSAKERITFTARSPLCFFLILFAKPLCQIRNFLAESMEGVPLCFLMERSKKPLTNTPKGYIIKIPLGGIYKEVLQMEDKTCCCHKTKERTEEEVKKLLNRLSRIEGQIRGIRGMVEKNAYCTDILVQSAAVSAAMNAFNRDLLANHIRTCVVTDIRDGKEDVIDELVLTLQKLMK